MKVYIEGIWFLNFLLDIFILYGTKRVLNRDIKTYRILLGSLLGSITTFLVFLKITNLELILIKIILSISMIIITFGRKNVKENTIYFYSISTILGGFFYLIRLPTNISYYELVIIVLSFFFIKGGIKEYKKVRSKQQNKYKVEITISKKKYRLDGFIDTGNQLVSPISHKSIILTNINPPNKKSYYVPFKALNTEGIIKCIKPDKLLINEKEIKSCLIGLSEEKLMIEGCNCILPNSLKEEL